MDEGLTLLETVDRTTRRRIEGILPAHPLRNVRSPTERHEAGTLSLKSVERGITRLTQVHRLFEHRVEYRLEVARRRIDDPQHLGGRGLLIQRLSRLGQQPHILHCND